jgi:hypothetical protein
MPCFSGFSKRAGQTRRGLKETAGGALATRRRPEEEEEENAVV